MSILHRRYKHRRTKAENYLYSSAGIYIGKDEQLEMELLDIGATEGYVDS
ncbi:hypothetical protein N9L92_00785 [Saprospiraceae bacterium]|nr:hypothetical protein [Saprospiraceae bacterium]